MKVGIIAPIKFLDKYCVTDIHYCLPGLLRESKEYRDFYLSERDEGKMLILDCKKLDWRRRPEELEVCATAIEDVRPTFVILPSYMYEAKKTVEVALYYKSKLPNYGSKLVGCLEGTTKEEVNWCMKSIKGVFTYAIPSHQYSICKKVNWTKPLIYIDNHLHLEELKGLDGILVTSLPVRLGLSGRLLSDYLPSPPSLTFYEEKDEYQLLTTKNVEETIEYYEMQ